MNTHDHRKLFSPVQIGPITLGHRVVMAPLTRSRSQQPGDIPNDLMREYYTQRASEGGFIVTEATNISITGRGWLGAPGMYSDQQVEGWKKITAAVRAKGCHMFSQLWHAGRSSHFEMTGGKEPVSASVNPAYWQDDSHVVSTPSGWVKPSPHRALDINEIPAIIEDYRQAAARAKAADFEGVELHAANGYLIDQFLQDGSNHRTDAYGGSVENRATSPTRSCRGTGIGLGWRSRCCTDRPKRNLEWHVRQQPAGTLRLCRRAVEPVWTRLPPHYRASRER
jgi:N-ethylmaleimide reductase